jgi:hypothetical protein
MTVAAAIGVGVGSLSTLRATHGRAEGVQASARFRTAAIAPGAAAPTPPVPDTAASTPPVPDTAAPTSLVPDTAAPTSPVASSTSVRAATVPQPATSSVTAAGGEIPPPDASTSSPPSVEASEGTLTATLESSSGEGVAGVAISMVLSVTDSAVTGPFGPVSVSYGDGQASPETGLPATCHAGASVAPGAESFRYSHAFAEPGTYTVSVLVAAPCSSEQVELDLPIIITAS